MSTQVQAQAYTIATMVSSYWDRLKPAMDAKGWGMQQLADAIGCSYQAVVKVRDGGSFGVKNNIKAASALGLDPTWLATGSGTSQPKTSPPKAFDANVKPVYEGLRAYPVISKVQAGKVKEITCPYEPGDGYAIEFGEDDASPWAFFLEIEGESMLPDFRPGDRVQIDPEVRPRPGDFVAARNTEQEATFKKYRVRGIDELGREIFELVPLNEDYPILRSDEVHLTVIGTMLEHRKRYRRKQKA